MKRCLTGFLVVAVLLLGGCRPQTPPEAKASDFSCGFEATLGDTVFGGALKRYTAGTLELTFDKPETVAGLTARWDGEAVKLQFHGLSFDVPSDSLPEQALGEAVVGVLDAVLRGDVTGTAQDGALTIDGALNGVDYTLVCDSANGMPKRLSVPDYELEIVFSAQ